MFKGRPERAVALERRAGGTGKGSLGPHVPGEERRDIADAIGVSPFTCARCSAGNRAQPASLPHHYACWALQPLADDIDILTVALASGFHTHSHFTAAFRTFGVLPSQFRRVFRSARWVSSGAGADPRPRYVPDDFLDPLETMNTRPE
jgi:hypothetical protein